MKVFPEITEIAEHIEAANNLIANIEKTHGEICEGVDWSSARFTKLSEEDISQLKQHGGETDEYYVDQRVGYLEDDFYGHVYFRTVRPGVFVDVTFAC